MYAAPLLEYWIQQCKQGSGLIFECTWNESLKRKRSIKLPVTSKQNSSIHSY